MQEVTTFLSLLPEGEGGDHDSWLQVIAYHWFVSLFQLKAVQNSRHYSKNGDAGCRVIGDAVTMLGRILYSSLKSDAGTF